MLWPIFFFLQVFVKAELKALIEVSRHGARAPIDVYPWTESQWPLGLGELTASGMRQHFLIGAELRERYIIQEQLLSPTFLQEEIYVRSTGTNRTLMSAESQLTGLYPQGPQLKASLADRAVPPIAVQNLEQLKQELGSNALLYKRQPIPVHSVPLAVDYLLNGYDPHTCARLGLIMEELHQQADYKNKIAEFEKPGGLQSQIEQYLNMTVDFLTASYMGDTLKCERWEGYPLPAGLPESVYQEMLAALNYTNEYLYRGEGGKIASSQFFEAVIYYFDGIIQGTTTEKFIFFSAHDLTLNAFQSALGVYSGGASPPFASTLFVELHANMTVRLVYNSVAKTMPGCVEFCPYLDFRAALQKLIVPNVDQVCNNITATEYKRINWDHFPTYIRAAK